MNQQCHRTKYLLYSEIIKTNKGVWSYFWINTHTFNYFFLVQCRQDCVQKWFFLLRRRLQNIICYNRISNSSILYSLYIFKCYVFCFFIWMQFLYLYLARVSLTQFWSFSFLIKSRIREYFCFISFFTTFT